MKYFVITIMLLTTVLSAHAELTSDDLLKISEIVNKSIKESETRMKEYIDIKFESVDTRFDSVDKRFEAIDKRFGEVGGKINILTAIVCALIGLIGVVIGIPTWQNRKDENALKKQVEILTQEIETLKNGRIQSS